MKHFYTMLVALCLSLSAMAQRTGKCGDNLTYTLTSDSTLTISGTGAMYDFYENLLNSEFTHSSVARIIVEEGVTHIGTNAFDRCENVTDVKLPSTLKTIGRMAFRDCSSLQSISLPDSLTYLGEEAFYSCTSLQNISIPALQDTLRVRTFKGCSSLDFIVIPEGIRVMQE